MTTYISLSDIEFVPNGNKLPVFGKVTNTETFAFSSLGKYAKKNHFGAFVSITEEEYNKGVLWSAEKEAEQQASTERLKNTHPYAKKTGRLVYDCSGPSWSHSVDWEEY